MDDISALTADDRTVGVGEGLRVFDNPREPFERDVQSEHTYRVSPGIADEQAEGGGLHIVFALFVWSHPTVLMVFHGVSIPVLLKIGFVVVVVDLEDSRVSCCLLVAGVFPIGVDDELPMEEGSVHGDGTADEHGVVLDHLAAVVAQGLGIVEVSLHVPAHHATRHLHLDEHIVDGEHRTVECQHGLRNRLLLHCLMGEVIHDRQRCHQQYGHKCDDP